MDRARVERPDQPHVLRQPSCSRSCSATRGEGRPADDAGARGGPGGRGQRARGRPASSTCSASTSTALGDDAARPLMALPRDATASSRIGAGRYALRLPDRGARAARRASSTSCATCCSPPPTTRRCAGSSPPRTTTTPSATTSTSSSCGTSCSSAGWRRSPRSRRPPRRASSTRRASRGWLTALNDLRLVLGTRLDVSEDDDDVDPDDPDAPAHAVYHYLGLLLGEVVDALERRPPAAHRTGGVAADGARLTLRRYPQRGTEPPSSSGLGHRPFTPAARVRIPLGVQQ